MRLLACLLACCLTYPHRGNSARSALAGQGAAAEAAARFALLCQCSPPTTTAIARPRSGLYCRLSTDLLLFAFVHAGCAHVSLASRTSQRLTSVYLTFVHSQSLRPCPPPPSVRCQHLPLRHHPPRCFGSRSYKTHALWSKIAIWAVLSYRGAL